jgi:hypothetical protein
MPANSCSANSEVTTTASKRVATRWFHALIAARPAGEPQVSGIFAGAIASRRSCEKSTAPTPRRAAQSATAVSVYLSETSMMSGRSRSSSRSTALVRRITRYPLPTAVLGTVTVIPAAACSTCHCRPGTIRIRSWPASA